MKLSLQDNSGKVMNRNVEVPFHKVISLYIAKCPSNEVIVSRLPADEYYYESFRIVTSGNLIGAKGINPHSWLDIYLSKQGLSENHVYRFGGFATCTIDELTDDNRRFLAEFMLDQLLKMVQS